MKKIGDILFYMIPVVLVGMILVFGGLFLRDFMQYRAAVHEYEALDEYIMEATPEEAASMAGFAAEPGAEAEAAEESAAEQAPFVYTPLKVDYARLSSINSDFVGVLDVPVLGIRYPVAQGETNDTYLHTTFEHKANFSGCLFLDAAASRDLSDANSIVFGHNMKNGSMFGKLKQLGTSDAAVDRYPFFYMYTPEGTLKYRIFACYTTGYDSPVYAPFSGDEGYDRYVQMVRNMSRYSPQAGDIQFSKRPKIMTLSTCYGRDNVSRFLVQGALVTDGEEDAPAEPAETGSGEEYLARPVQPEESASPQ